MYGDTHSLVHRIRCAPDIFNDVCFVASSLFYSTEDFLSTTHVLVTLGISATSNLSLRHVHGHRINACHLLYIMLTSVVTSNWVCSSCLVSMVAVVVVILVGSTDANKTSATSLDTSVAAGVMGIVSSRLS